MITDETSMIRKQFFLWNVLDLSFL